MSHSIRTATAKDFRIHVKKGRTFAYLQEHYSCSEEDVRGRIRQLFRNEAKKVERGLETNASKESRRPEETSIAEVSTEDTVQLVQSNIGNMSLEELQAHRQQIDDELASLVDRIARLKNDSRQQGWTASQICKEINGLKQRIENLESKYNQALADQQQAEDLKSEAAIQFAQKQDMQYWVLQEIERRTSVSICIYEDGEIEVIENSEFELCDDGYTELVSDLIKQGDLQYLRVIDINTLARVKKIQENASKELTLQFVFASAELERAFALLP